MADPPRSSDFKPHTTPRWVKVLGIIALLAVLVLVVMMVAGGGQHGPGRHALEGNASTGQMSSAEGHVPPADVPSRPWS